jgi:hypothetical protein
MQKPALEAPADASEDTNPPNLSRFLYLTLRHERKEKTQLFATGFLCLLTDMGAA